MTRRVNITLTSGFSKISGSLWIAGGYMATLSPFLRLYFRPSSVSNSVSSATDLTMKTPPETLRVSLVMLSVMKNNEYHK